MSEAVKLIVDAFVRLKDREKIEELREHRRLLRKSLEERTSSAFDVGPAIRLMDSDLKAIEAGLERLQ